MAVGGVLAVVGAGVAWACCTPPGHQVRLPSVVIQPPVITHAPPGSGGSGCCGPVDHQIRVPGVNVGGVHVNVPPPVIFNPNIIGVTVGAVGTVSGGSQTFLSGGSTYFEPTPVQPGFVEFTTPAETQTVTEQVPETEDTCVDEVRETFEMRAIQAMCVDDTGTPHPASQVFPERAINASYSGEVFRCLAGSTMQVTIADQAGENPTFAAGRSFSCARGDALVHQPGGSLVCEPQAPERDCNERSLLRRFGPGIKTVSLRTQSTVCVPTTRTVMRTVTRQVTVENPQALNGRLELDGGVGQTVF
jgi:hypothetical protein